MDIASLISIYGNPTIKECIHCKGEGCMQCNDFGYIVESENKNISYTFKYPLYINVKKRDEADFIRNSFLTILSLLGIFALIASYVINILNHS